MAKLRVGLLFGGRSVEHEVSLASATCILKALDPTRYDISLVCVEPDGRWRVAAPGLPLGESEPRAEVHLPAVPAKPALVALGASEIGPAGDIDVVFPVIHDRGGEDGSLQGLLELAEVPYVGSRVLGSALQMDKEVAKRLLAAAGIPVLPGVSLRRAEVLESPAAVARRVLDALALPVFVKPVNSGSSVGISRVDDEAALVPALRDAARYDTKLLVERGIDAREIEVALLGNHPLEASVPGEIRTNHAFYDYEAKYVAEDTELLVPAPLDEAESARVRELAVAAGDALEAEGLARVDFLLNASSGELFVNEVNSLPGFTEGSMFPRLWEASGLPYPALLDRLIELALERHRERSGLETMYRGRSL